MWPFRMFRTFKDALPTLRVENTIAAGTTIRGELKGTGGFQIDGSVEGSINAEGPVVIGERGAVDGTVRAADVIVLGRIRGDVHAKGHLEIGPKGKILGDITVISMKMHEGGIFRGTSKMSGAENLTTATNPFGVLPAASPAMDEKPESNTPSSGRTLPPPVGAVPPPPPPRIGVIACESVPVASEDRIVVPGSPGTTKEVANG